MKLNLPSTLTQQKAWSLFFLTLLHLKTSEAGQAFKNCLRGGMGDDAAYDALSNYYSSLASIKKGWTDLCCTGTNWDRKSVV